MKNIIRHGDVNLHSAEKMEGAVIKTNGSFVLELGETTGHRHVITVERPADLVISKTADGRYFLELKAPGKLTHEEHATIALAPDHYEVVQQREYTPEVIRNVAD